jgi:DNA invertase Pin-like site-specific DNA recombinase
MMRAALYARFSTDKQSPTSVEDQLVVCRRYAEQIGARVVGEFADAGISGASMGNRPEARALLDCARRGECDVVIAEHLDRSSRAGSDSWAIYEDLKALGVRYFTVNQGEITAMHVGTSAMLSVMLLEENAKKTRRGLQGVVRSGRSAGGLSYGYAVRQTYDAKGERIRGLREIVPAEAEVVVRIFTSYARGESPQRIAAS